MISDCGGKTRYRSPRERLAPSREVEGMADLLLGGGDDGAVAMCRRLVVVAASEVGLVSRRMALRNVAPDDSPVPDDQQRQKSAASPNPGVVVT
jgi:hypothetical protein